MPHSQVGHPIGASVEKVIKWDIQDFPKPALVVYILRGLCLTVKGVILPVCKLCV